ncbi:MAG: hypothetical protein DMG09_06340 [Acidobacteria bacterium]|nr:MAG: hypothetical protein DMG09_06340 [Acidobacteriota bacterium]
MKRGDVWWVNFEPAVGGEVRKQRPAVIVTQSTTWDAGMKAWDGVKILARLGSGQGLSRNIIKAIILKALLTAWSLPQ